LAGPFSSTPAATTGAKTPPTLAPFRPPWSHRCLFRPHSAHSIQASLHPRHQVQPPSSPKKEPNLHRHLTKSEKITKPIKTADKPTPAPPKHIQPVTPPPTKAVTGETAGVRIAQSTLEVKNGTASVSVEDRTFGQRFAYYVNIVNSKVAQNWYTAEADPRTSIGKSTTIIFDINREGVPSNARVETSSGSPTLDLSAMRAVQRVDGFGPLPQGDHITVEYTFHLHPQ
jgi:protein TonB